MAFSCAQRFLMFFLVAFPILLLQILSFLWIRKLRASHATCACAQHWKAKYIHYYLGAIIIINLIMNAFLLLQACFHWSMPSFVGAKWLPFIAIVQLCSGIAFLVFSLQYLHYLKSSACTCATQGKGDDLLKALVILQAIFIGLALFIMMVAGILFAGMMRRNQDRVNGKRKPT